MSDEQIKKVITRDEEIKHWVREQIVAVQLTPEEQEAAIWEGKRKKFFHEKHKDYWQQQEHKPKKDGTISNKTTE